MNKKTKIEQIINLLKESNVDYVDNVYRLLVEDNIYCVDQVLGKDNYEALKTNILSEESEE